MNPLNFLLSDSNEETSPLILKGGIKRIINRSTGSTGIAAMSIRLDVGGSVQPHNHQAEEVYLIASGSGEILIGDRLLRVSKDMLVFVPSNIQHQVTNTGKEPFVFFAFMAPIS